ncbi:Suppressor of cytokine signaling 6 [Pteropus alecto]|uniref:Suppressor of cytokine signaling 6 n=1 Tax=Pteropus alecto TaxID=9402 RepID=L5KWT9_PTEAL|nr:Suppressor of cytokine signaling 6 [Pteropus alecto]
MSGATVPERLGALDGVSGHNEGNESSNLRTPSSLEKSRKERDFMAVRQPSPACEFGSLDSIFGSGSGGGRASCDINSQDEKGAIIDQRARA